MRVGGLEETIAVTGETPIVDVQSTTRQRVLDHAAIDAIPTGRSDRNLALLIPGVNIGGATINQDVGGTADQQNATMSVHGSRGGDQRIMQNGVSIGITAASGANSLITPNMSAYQEVHVETGAVSAELASGGVRVNFIPKDGGNTFSGTMFASVFASVANSSMQGGNFNDELRAILGTPDGLKRDCDLTNPAAQDTRATGGDLCGAMANAAFGRSNTTGSVTYDPEVISGWGLRTYNWEVSAGVQQEVFPRVSVDATFFRRWYGNFFVTDNRATALTNPFCDATTPFLTQVKFLAAYTVPRIGVQVSGTLQSIPGPVANANFVAVNALVQPSLGRPLSGNAANVTRSLIDPNSVYAERVNQVDLRVGKVFRFGGARAWQSPQSVLQPRLLKISTQLDF